MLPEVQQYCDTVETAEDAHDLRTLTAHEAYQAVAGKAERDRQASSADKPQHNFGGPAGNECPGCVYEAKVRESWERATAEPRRAREIALEASAGMYDQERKAAWAKLMESENPTVRFIAEYCYGFKSEALIVLSMLPVSLDEIRSVARRYGWCDVYWGDGDERGFDRLAVETGAIEDSKVSVDAARYGTTDRSLCTCSACVAEREDSSL